MIRISEIYILDEKLRLISTIDNFEKIELKTNFYEADAFSIDLDFKIVCDPHSIDYKKYKNIYESLASMYENEVYKPRYLFTDFNKRLNIIESFEIDELGATLSIKGRGFINLLEKRYTIEKEYIPEPSQNDSVGRVISKIINDNHPPSFLIVDENKNAVGAEIYTFTKIDGNVYEKIVSLSSAYEVGFSSIIDYENKKVYFNVVEKSNVMNTSVSLDDKNLISNVYELDIASHYNCALVMGEDENEGQINAIVDNTNGQEALQLVIESRNKKKRETILTDYYKLLEAEGIEELAKNKTEEHFDIDITNDIDVDLGDKVLVKINVGCEEIIKEIIVTSINYSFDKRKYKREVGFGKPFNLSQELKKSLKL